jgi:signal transduction histidine kinase
MDVVVEEVARAGAVLASDRKASVQLTNLPEAVFHGDEDLLRQMLLNLVDNAVKFTPSDGAVTLSLERREDEYLLAVIDAGPGIPSEARRHIFERFYRADRVRTSAEDGGAGLGLSIARWIARAHDGDIELDDSGGTGTKFIVRLPARESN